MRKLATTAGLLAVAFTAAPAHASAEPYLGAGESCRVAGQIVHREYTHVVPGSSAGHCHTQRHPYRSDRQLVSISYLDRGDQWWNTTISLRETWDGYRYRILSDRRVRRPL
jgi:hypothetical protein